MMVIIADDNVDLALLGVMKRGNNVHNYVKVEVMIVKAQLLHHLLLVRKKVE